MYVIPQEKIEAIAAGDDRASADEVRVMATEIAELREILPGIKRQFKRWNDVRTLSGAPSSTQRADTYLKAVENPAPLPEFI